ncbi:OmpA family protein [Paraburkholderia domus]|uniref:Outer membrane protein A n=1 Tax=Paraburkholderia domus TaxID=2793075 RepID=A0A9N8R1B0_9BURK|nr:OmpA family protein [Paraburkholderia domus]MBK5169402.1 OmpA family protein [Burkholderia sp. R-70211]CAE6935714.1 Outer membrane protein A [Paraburkholderia domus]
MKSIDLAQTLKSTFPRSLLEQLSGQFGLSPEVLEQIIIHAGPALIASLMAVGASSHGASALFETIMLPQTNARIAQQLPDLVATTAGLKKLESAGHALAARATALGSTTLSDLVAAHTGVPAQAVCAFSGVIAAALFGAIKHHILLDQGTADELPALLADQWSTVAPHMTDALATSVGVESAAVFRDSIPGRLRLLAGTLKGQAAARAEIPDEIHTPVKVANPPTRKVWRLRGWVWVLFAILALVLAALFTYNSLHPVADRSERASIEPTVAAGSMQPGSAAQTTVPGTVSSQAPAASAAVPVASPATATSAPGESANAPAPHAASSAVSASQPAVASALRNAQLVLGAGKAGGQALTATVGNEAEKTQIIDALNQRFGAGHFLADVTVDQGTARADWLDHISALLPLMSLPHADVTIDGRTIELGGAAAEDRLGWLQRLQGQFGPEYRIKAFHSDQALAEATAAFRNAMAARTQGSSCAAADVSKILSLQVVDFERSSGHVPSSAVENLDKSAQLIRACQNSGKTAKLAIQAFSDNVGDPQANLELSKKRAEAVRDFLVHDGIPADLLTAQGYGVAQPVASNLTAHGRFANRRIEFLAAQ